jgi:hypothetical protein
MCDYRSTYLDLKDNSDVAYSCPHKPFGKSPKHHGALCIFHDPRENKDARRFWRDFLALYRSGDHIFCGFVFPRGFSFSRLREETGALRFVNPVFSDAVFLSRADLSGAAFAGDGGANFIASAFQGEAAASFAGTRFEGGGGANFRMAKFGGTGVTDFGRAVFRGGSADFTWAKFATDGGVDFKLAEFAGTGAADFHFAEFTGKVANFTGARFGKDGGVNFSLIQFSGGDGANFSSTRFTGKGQANFSTTNFSGRGGANFAKAEFSCDGGVNFSLAQLSGKSKANFTGARFFCEGPVNFSRARFSGGSGADFKGAEFYCPGGVAFSDATFAGEGRILFSGRTFHEGTSVDFRDVLLEFPERVTFEAVDLSRARFLFTDVTRVNFIGVSWCGRRYNASPFSGRVKVFDELFQQRGRIMRRVMGIARRIGLAKLMSAVVERMRPKGGAARGPSGSPIRRFFDYALIRANVWAAPKEQNHWAVFRLYNQLSVNYTAAFRPHEAGDFFAGQMEMRRRENLENPLTRVGLWFYRLFSLFGERPAYALVWLVVVAVLSGIINLKSGIAAMPQELGPIAVEETAVSTPAAEPAYRVTDLVKYDTISIGDLSSPSFRADFLRALSVALGAFVPGRVMSRYVLVDPLAGPYILLAETLFFILFFFLFAAGVWRKFGSRAR